MTESSAHAAECHDTTSMDAPSQSSRVTELDSDPRPTRSRELSIASSSHSEAVAVACESRQPLMHEGGTSDELDDAA